MWTGSNHQTDVKDPSVCDHVCADHQQYAAVEALRNGDEDVAMMREEYNADAVMYWSGSKRWDFPVLNHLEHFMRSLVLRIWV